MKKIYSIFIALSIILAFQVQVSAQTVVWSEDWEGTWTDDWHVDAGTWEVGLPASGPDSAFNGQSCAATVLGGNYTDGIETRLIRHTSFVVPSASQNPRFRFQHWYSFSSNDYGCVMIKTENLDWVKVSPEYRATSSGIWTHAFIDLSAYADSTVQVAFFVHTAASWNGTNVSNGWYVDDVSVETGSLTFNNPEDWESGIGDWYSDLSIWEVGHPTSGPDSAFAGTNCLSTILDGNYTDNRESKFISQKFNVPSASQNPALRFWHWFSFSSNDYGNVQIRTLNGEWEIISDNYSATSSGTWSNTYFDLSTYADSTVQIAFFVHTAASWNGSNVSSGWYIDDVTIIPIEEQPNEQPTLSMTDTVTFINNSSSVLNMWDFANDAETVDLDLTYSFSVSDASLIWGFDSGTGELTLTAPGFEGTAKLYASITDEAGASAFDTLVAIVTIPVGIDYLDNNPLQYNLQQNYPNPFNQYTSIAFSLPKAGDVKIEIYDIQGQG